MALSQDELQSIINAVISSIRTNSKTIGQLTPATMLEDTDCFEIDGGKKVSFSLLKDAIKNIIESLKTRRIIIFDEVSKQGTIKMLSSVDTDLVIAWVESEKRFGARKNQGSGLVPINPEYYSNWRGREKWCGADGKPYADTLYVCDGTIYVASEDLSGLVALLPQELVAWLENVTERLNNFATKEQVKPLENLKADISDTTFMAARDGFNTSVEPSATDVPLSFPTVRATGDGVLTEDDKKLTYTIPAATNERAGVMTAADKKQQEKLSEAVSELQRLVDEDTGAIIPDLDIGFSVDLI